MLRQPLIAAAFALAAIGASPAPGGAAPLQNGSDFEASAAHPAIGTNPAQPGTEANAVQQSGPVNAAPHRAVVVHHTVVNHVYHYEPAAPYYGYYAPSYAPPPVVALPAAAACLALSVVGAC
jgi:hypothetical protein